MRSLRTRLLVGTLAGTSLIFAASGVAIYAAVRTQLRNQLDGSLEALIRSSAATAIAEQGWGTLEAEEPEPRFVLDGVAFSPWVEGQDPRLGDVVPLQQLWDRLQLVRRDALTIRTYGVGGGLDAAPEMIHLLGLRSVIGAWVGSDPEENDRELDMLIDLAHRGHVDVAVVGNEVLTRGDLDVGALVALLRRARAELPPDVPLASSETWDRWLGSPELIAAVDQVYVNYHPYWNGVAVEQAVASLACWHGSVVDASLGKDVVVGETGWPSSGPSYGAAVPSAANAVRYLQEFVAWARLNEVEFHYFSAFDEPWKLAQEGGAGPNWGYRDAVGKLKPGNRLVFDGPLAPVDPPAVALLGVPSDGQEVPLVGQVRNVGSFNHHLAVYVRKDGGWWTQPSFEEPVVAIGCDGSFSVELDTGLGAESADRLLAVVLPEGSVPPILSGAAELPPALFERAVALEEVVR